MLKTFKELQVWQKTYQLNLRIYELTRSFPGDEKFGLISPLRRAAISIPSNIAEGYNRRSTRDYLRFLNMAMGSLAEIETQLLMSKDLNYTSCEMMNELNDNIYEIDRMMKSLIKSLKIKLKTRSSMDNSSL